MRSKLNQALAFVGLEPAKALRFARNLPNFLRAARAYALATSKDDPFRLKISGLRPILFNFDDQAGNASGDYFHQDLWAARKIFRARPSRHLDVGSRIDGFVTHLLTFMSVEVIDIRPLKGTVEGLRFVQGDATDLADIASGSVESISSLHAVEHFGLGRYGDPIDPRAWHKAARSLARVLERRGKLYFSVPIGRERLEFNSQRIFSPSTILNTFDDLDLLSFAVVDNCGDFREAVCPDDFKSVKRACGLFEFTKS